MIYQLFYYLFGNVKVRATGVFVERFINLISKRGIKIWDIAKVSESQVTFFLSKNHFKKLRKPAKRTGVKVQIVSKNGVPFIYDKYKHRYALLGGVLIFFVTLFALSQFIWTIDVVGNEKLEVPSILDELQNLGVKRGAYKQSLELDAIMNQAMMNIPELSFISINFKGSRCEIQVKERIPKPENKSYITPRSIVSKSDGQIEILEIYDGEPVVRRGDTVLKGDLLVNGVVPTRDENYYVVASDAKIIAHIWKNGAIKAPRIATAKIQGNREIQRHSINISGFEIKLFLNTRISIPTYDRIEEVTVVNLPFGMKIPIFVKTETYREYFVLSRVQTDEELVALCTNKLIAYQNSLELIETFDVTEDMQITQDGATLFFVIDGMMNIVEYQEITETIAQ